MKRRVCPRGPRPELGAGSRQGEHSSSWSNLAVCRGAPSHLRPFWAPRSWDSPNPWSFGEEAHVQPHKALLASTEPLPLILSSLALPACLSVSLLLCVDLCASCVSWPHTHAALFLCASLLSGSLPCNDCLCAYVFLSGFLFLLFSLVLLCLTVSLSSSVPLGFCLSACQSSLFLSVLCLWLTIYPPIHPHIHTYIYLYLAMRGFSCPTVDSKGGLSFTEVEPPTVSTPA